MFHNLQQYKNKQMKKQDLVLLHYLEVVHHLNQYKNQKLDMVQHNL